MNRAHRVGVLALAVAAASGVQADDRLDAVQVVSSAAGYEQKITAAPASVTVITAQELARKPYTTLLDALRDVEGIDVGASQDKSGQSTINMRGMGSEYTLILIDGKRQNDNGDLYPNNFGGFQTAFIPPMDMIERIEVIRGPMSTLYGADALGGVINIITKKNADRWGGSLSTSRTFQENSDWGDISTHDFYLSGPLVDQRLSLSLRGSYYDRAESTPERSQTPLIDPNGVPHVPRQTGFGGGGKTVDNQNWTLGGRLSFTPHVRHQFVFDYDIARQKYDNRQGQLGTVDLPETILRNGRVGYAPIQRIEREQFYLAHFGEWDFGRSEISIQHIETDNFGRSLPLDALQRQQLEDLQNDPALSQDEKIQWINDNLMPRPQRELSSRSTNLDAKLEVPFRDSHMFIVGGQVIDGEMEDGVFGMLRGRYKRGAVQEHEQWSVFAEDHWFITPQLTVTTGIRYDDHSMFGDHISPRLYGVYQLNDQWTFKGGVSTGYKTPKTTDLFPGITGFGGQGTSPWAGNPNLDPETSLNKEVALYWTAPAGHSVNVTVFQTDFEDKIDSRGNCRATPDVPACAAVDPWWLTKYAVSYKDNVGDAEINGVEVAGRLVLPHGLSLRANYTYTDGQITSGPNKGERLASAGVRHLFNSTLDWQASPRLTTYLSMEGQSKRFRGTTSSNGARYYKSFQVYHLGAIFQAADNVTLSARVNNLFDHDYTDMSYYFEPDGADWTLVEQSDYNVIHASRSFWLSANITF